MVISILLMLVAGGLFGAGLVHSGMTLPHKVIGFLDFFGDWDPTLAFVMVGAIGVHSIAYLISKIQKKPWLAEKYYVPKNKKVDRPLVIGSPLFGMGWGIGGYCPGPGIVSLSSQQASVMVFVIAMLVGIVLHRVGGRPNL